MSPMTKRIIDLKDQGVSWTKLYPLIREEFEDAPSDASIRRRYYNRNSRKRVSIHRAKRNPPPTGGFKIPFFNDTATTEIYTRQLQSMNLSSKEIQEELKRLIG
jgi:hypothetical protein